MYYTFDTFGRFAGESTTSTDRSTTIAPAQSSPDYNWNGVAWVYAPNVQTHQITASAPPPAPVDPCLNFIDIGPFYDRFGAAKMPVLMSADSAVQAIIADLNIRKWVDLARADVAQALAYIGTKVPSVTAELQQAILTTPVATTENLALRRLYFS